MTGRTTSNRPPPAKVACPTCGAAMDPRGLPGHIRAIHDHGHAAKRGDRVIWSPSTDEEESLTPGRLDGFAGRIFTYGGCGALAIALHDETGWPIVAITDAHNVHDGRAGGGSALHWMVRHPSGMLMDVDGLHNAADMVEHYDGDADDGKAAAGISTRADAEEWWEAGGRKVRIETAALFVAAVLEKSAKDMAASISTSQHPL